MRELRLAIAGELRSGKTTLSNYAESHYHMTPFALGDELKKGFHYHYPHIPRNPKPRKGYQLYGQLMRCVYGDDHWLNIMLEEIEGCRKAKKGYNFFSSAEATLAPLVTDARQQNEFEKLREEGYKIIKVIAPYNMRLDRARAEGDNFTEEEMNHETELYISQLEPDYTIFNEGTVEELYAQFDKVIENIRYGGV